ncbi:MAG: pyrimidine 5'-nucleotidase [Alphaproteobacteria bacterium]
MSHKFLSPDAPERLRHAQAWVLDLDNTLYPADCRLFDQIDQRMGAFISDLLDVDPEEAKRVQKNYFYEYGTTLNGLMKIHGIKPDAFLDYVHDIDVSAVDPDHELAKALNALPGPCYVFTNGSMQHAENVLTQLGARDAIDGIVDIKASAYVPKPSERGYRVVADTFGIDLRRAVMVEDIARNLVPARKLGMVTVWVPNDYAWAGPAASKFKAESTEAEVADAIDAVTEDLADFLSLFARDGVPA